MKRLKIPSPSGNRAQRERRNRMVRAWRFIFLLPTVLVAVLFAVSRLIPMVGVDQLDILPWAISWIVSFVIVATVMRDDLRG